MSWLLISTLATTTPRAELVLGHAIFVGIDGGLIGLNTTEPRSTLHVGGDVTTDSRLHIGSDHPSASVGSAINVNLQLGQAFTRADTLARSGLRINTSPDSGSNHLTIGEIDSSDTAANGAYYISVSNYAGTANWPICLNPWGGNVGIGTRHPSATLDVQGSVKCTSLSQTSDRTLKANIAPTSLGLAFVRQCLQRGDELRFLLVALAITLIGVGSMAFHGTLQRWGQVLDEVPMLWASLILLWIALSLRCGMDPHGEPPNFQRTPNNMASLL